MEELLIFSDVLERLETSPFDPYLQAGPHDPIVQQSTQWTLDLMKTFIGPEGLQALLADGTPLWMAQLIAADVTGALEREWLASDSEEGFLRVMPWARRLLPRLDEHGAPPTSTRCLLRFRNTHEIGPHGEERDLGEAITKQRDDIIESTLDIRGAPTLIERLRRTRKFWHDINKFTDEGGVPCLAVWWTYTKQKRLARPWNTYLRSEWGIDETNQMVEQPRRSFQDPLHSGLLVKALRTRGLATDLVRAIDRAFADPDVADPCSHAYAATQRLFHSGWASDSVMMRSAPLPGQRTAFGVSLAAHILTKISLGRSRGSKKVRGHPGKRLDAAIHDLWHDDPSVSCVHAHDAALLRETLSLVWSDADIHELARTNGAHGSEFDLRLGKIANKLTNRIIREARARRRLRATGVVAETERREVRLAVDVADHTADPLEELVAREDAEHGRLMEECLELLPLLPRRQREIAELKLVCGLSHPQIAARLQLTEGGVKANWFKAKRNLRELVARRFEQSGDVA